jgi:hypothetical protein
MRKVLSLSESGKRNTRQDSEHGGRPKLKARVPGFVEIFGTSRFASLV